MFNKRKTLNIGGHLLVLDKPVVMGVVNLTPDSFYSGSRAQTATEIRSSIETHIAGGACILDLGGCSTRPNSQLVSPQQELARTIEGVEIACRVIEEQGKAGEIFISIDTFRSEIVRELAENFGGFIVNDISGGLFDPSIIDVTAHYGLPYIIGHTKGTPNQMMSQCDYPKGLMIELLEHFVERVELCYRAGVKDILIDPCFGFAKTLEQNYELLSRYCDLRVLELPTLASLSRKSMINKALDVEPADNLSLLGTSILNFEALSGGADILRVHDSLEATATINLFARTRTRQ